MTRDAIDGPDARGRILARSWFSRSRFARSRFARSCDESARIGCITIHLHSRGATRDGGRTRARVRARAAKTSERTDERTNGRCGVRVRSIYSMNLLNVVGSVSRASRGVGFPFGGTRARARARARVGTVSVLVVVVVSVAIDGRVTTIHLFANQRARVRRDLVEEMSTTGAAKRAARVFVFVFVFV